MTDERSLSDLDTALAATKPELAGELEAATFSVALARRVLTIRRDRGWTQEDLAERAGMSQQQIADIERLAANPTLTTLDRLFTALELPKGFREAS